jgi:acetyl esterase/lipase
LDALAAGRTPHALEATVAARRRGLAELLTLGGPEMAVGRVEDQTLARSGNPLSVRLYTPLHAEGEMLPGLVFFHGGGLVAGSVATHDGIGRALSHFGACRVVSVDYRLAPEHPFPAALEDAQWAVSYVSANAARFGIDGTRLGVCGDSAGGALAAATCQAAVRDGTARLALQMLICPILDYSRSTASHREFARGYLLEEATLADDLTHYAPGSDPGDPRISPLRAPDVSGLPHTRIHTAEFDPVRDDGREYFERLNGVNGSVSYTCHPGMIHLFYGLGAVIPYARTALELIGGEIRAALAASSREK